MASKHNILVVSDLHLGEDLSPTATDQCVRDLGLAERNLIEFVRHYTRRRVDGRPWRLVINGDMVDFLAICVLPDDPRLAGGGQGARPDERTHGLGRRAEVAVVQVAAALDRHRELTATLARFCAAGNRIEVISGNHDTEMQFTEVQEQFRTRIQQAWVELPQAARPGAPDAAAIGAAIDFHPWFFYEPGVAWIEHGHQYDEACSFEYGLHPVDAARGEIITNVDAAGIRYVTNQIPEAEPHGTESWSFGGYLRFAYGLGWREAGRLIKGYYLFTRSLIETWRAHRSGVIDARIHHSESMSALSQRWQVPMESLRAIDALRRAPIATNLNRLCQLLMLDKLALTAGAVLGGLLALLVLPLAWALLIATGLVVASRVAGHYLSRGRCVNPTLPLQIVPARIRRHVDAPFVVFGHTHEPLSKPLGEDGWYFNTGTWLPSGRPGVLRSFTHLVIRHGAAGPKATLCQWRDGASRAFTPGWAPAHAAAGDSLVGVPAAAPAPEPATAGATRRTAVQAA